MSYGADGDVQTVRYQELIPMLLNKLQRQASEIAHLRTQQEQEIGALQARLAELEHAKAAHDANGNLAAAFER